MKLWCSLHDNHDIYRLFALTRDVPYLGVDMGKGEGRKECTTLAAELFCSLERSAKVGGARAICNALTDLPLLFQLKHPLAWMFIRPPWSYSTVCKKIMVYDHILKLIDNDTNSANLCYCIAKVHMVEVKFIESYP